MNGIKTVDEFIKASQDPSVSANEKQAWAIGKELGEAILNHVNPNIFTSEAIIIAIGFFNDNQSLSERVDTVPFFKNNRHAIIEWLERCTPNKDPKEISEKLATSLTNVFGEYFSPTEVEAVVFANNEDSQSYNRIADTCTKMAARALAKWFVKDHRPTITMQ